MKEGHGFEVTHGLGNPDMLIELAGEIRERNAREAEAVAAASTISAQQLQSAPAA
ncbi:MAG TPA: hypothetical protein PLY91_05400 [Methanoregulaceae archaeon]|nr:hypothetical protein [Methanoregulaceae archaeon]